MIWMLCGYLWLFIHRPFEYWTFLGDIRIQRIYMICTMLVWAMYPAKAWVSNRLNVAMLFFTFALVAAWLASPFDLELGERVWDEHYKIGVLFIMLITTVRDEKSLKAVLFAYFVGIFMFQFHSFYEFICGRYEFRMGTYRMNGINASYGDPNTFSASLLHALPYLMPFWLCVRGPKVKPMIVCHVLLSLACIYFTGSRRAWIGVGFLTFLLTIRSKHRWSLLGLYAILAPLAFMVMRDDLQTRLVTLWDASAGTRGAHTSAQFRWKALIDSLELFQKSPLLGTGPATFSIASGNGLQAHNLYAQTLSEMGALGVIALLAMVYCYWRNAREIDRVYRDHPWWEKDFTYYVGRVTWLAVVLLLFMGAGGHNLFRYNWLWFAAFQMAALHVAKRRAEHELAYG